MTLIRKLWLPVTAIAALLLIIAAMAGLFRDKIEPGVSAPVDVIDADAIPVRKRTITNYEPVPASVEAKQATLISSRILARITRIHVRAGDLVDEGQLLIELEKTDLSARSQQAREQVRAVSARLTEAEQTLKRIAELQQQGLVSAAELDGARATRDSLDAQLASAQRALEAAEAAVDFSAIRSPIVGRVVDRFAEPGDTASPGTTLLSLYNPLSLRIEARVREELALSLALNQNLSVEIPALGKAVAATIEEIVPAAERGSRSFLIKASIPYDNTLLPGMYARVLIPAGSAEVLTVARDRVARVGQLDVVWVLQTNETEDERENGQETQVARRFVRLGHQLGDTDIEITAGLKEGELVLPPPQ